MTAALSILSLEPAHSEAQVIGRVGRENAAWLAERLRSLEGDVTLDCSRLRLRPGGMRTLLEFERFLQLRGRRLVLRGLSDPLRHFRRASHAA